MQYNGRSSSKYQIGQIDSIILHCAQSYSFVIFHGTEIYLKQDKFESSEGLFNCVLQSRKNVIELTEKISRAENVVTSMNHDLIHSFSHPSNKFSL